GRRLDRIAVYANPLAQAALAALHAEAVTYQGAIFVANPHPPLELIAHEVVHALQMGAGISDAKTQRREGGGDIVVAAADPAEHEATTLAAQVQREPPAPLLRPPLPVMATLPPAAVALRRTNLPVPPTSEPAAETFRRNAEREPAPAPPEQTVAPPTPEPQPPASPL
ncbi:MAG: DUF4157 domain-containing protein, partial [Chloroflexus sp.]|nr:DUF4157 domain-containing protein [Chloroflexus sp.]